LKLLDVRQSSAFSGCFEEIERRLPLGSLRQQQQGYEKMGLSAVETTSKEAAYY